MGVLAEGEGGVVDMTAGGLEGLLKKGIAIESVGGAVVAGAAEAESGLLEWTGSVVVTEVVGGSSLGLLLRAL